MASSIGSDACPRPPYRRSDRAAPAVAEHAAQPPGKVYLSQEDCPDWLDLDGYSFVKRRTETEEYRDPITGKTQIRTEYFVTARLTRLSSRCIFCGAEGRLHQLRLNRQGIRDQSIRGAPCMIEVDRPYVKGGVKPGQCGGVKVGQSIVGGCCGIAG